MIPNGKVLMKQVVVTLPKSHVGSEPGVLSKPVVNTLQSLHLAVQGLYILGEVGYELRYSDLCWKMESDCIQETPISIFQDTNEDPIIAINDAYEHANDTRMFELGFKGIVRDENSLKIIGAESFVFSYFFNVTTPLQEHLVAIWEKRLGALKLTNFYSQDLSQNFHNVLPDGKVVYDIFEGINKAKQLLQTSHQNDLVMHGIAIFLMHSILLNLLLSMRAIGSKFTLAFAVCLSSSFALIAGLVTIRIVGVSVSARELFEAIPFFVIAIGFEKPMLLTKAIYDAAEKAERSELRGKVAEGVQTVCKSILMDYAIEIGALFISSFFGTSIGRFCFLASMILIFDAIFLFSFYLCIVLLKLELSRLYDEKQKIENSQSNSRRKSVSEESKASTFIARAKLITILTFLTFHAVAASGSLNSLRSIQEYSLKIFDAQIGSASVASSLLGTFDRSTTIIQVSKPYVAHPIWVPTVISDLTMDSIVETRESESIINPDNLTLFSVFIAAAATIIVRIYNFADPDKTEPIESMAVAVSVPSMPTKLKKTDSGVDFDDEDLNLILEKQKKLGILSLEDEEIIKLVDSKVLASHSLEKTLGDHTRAVSIRRKLVSREARSDISSSLLPVADFDYKQVFGVCCENVIGYIPLPVGVAGPFKIDNDVYQIPMATTEGCLVASTSRGCKAITLGGGARTEIIKDGMTRGPVVSFDSIRHSAELKRYIDSTPGFQAIKEEFESTSRFAKLQQIKVCLAGKLAYLRFVTTTGDAMGMNMISKGTEKSLASNLEIN